MVVSKSLLTILIVGMFLAALAPISSAWDPSKYSLNSSSYRIGAGDYYRTSFVQRFAQMGGKACAPIKEVKCDSGYLVRKTISGGCQAQPTCCGNSQCDQGENPSNCPRDCFLPAQSKDSCPKIAAPACKGRLIYQVQVKGGCPLAPSCCGDGTCQSNEGAVSCPDDCSLAKKTTERSYCPKYPFPHCVGIYIYPKKDRMGCTGQPTCCGNQACEPPLESGLNCPADCGKGTINGSSYKPFKVSGKDTFRDAKPSGFILGAKPSDY